MFKRTTKVSLAELIKEGIRGDLLNLHTSMPGKVKVYYKDEQKADIIPLIKKKYKSNNNEVEISVIQDVPVYCLSCNNGDTFMHIPIKEGDLGMLVFCERSIDNYLSSIPDENDSIKPIYHNSYRHHDISDAWFIPGILPFRKSLNNISSDDIIIKNSNIEVHIKPNGKIVINNGSYELVETLSTLIQNLIDAKVITMMGAQPFIASTITALTQDKTKIDSFKD